MINTNIAKGLPNKCSLSGGVGKYGSEFGSSLPYPYLFYKALIYIIITFLKVIIKLIFIICLQNLVFLQYHHYEIITLIYFLFLILCF